MRGEKQTIPKKNNSYHGQTEVKEKTTTTKQTKKQKNKPLTKHLTSQRNYNTEPFVDSYVKKKNLYLELTNVVSFNNFKPIRTGIDKCKVNVINRNRNTILRRLSNIHQTNNKSD